MKKVFSLFIFVFMLGNVFSQTVKNVSDAVPADKRQFAADLIDKVEKEFKYMDSDFSATMTLVVDKPGEPTNQMQFKLFARSAKDQFSLIQLQPEADKGTGYLQEGDNMWMYDPIGRKFSHTSIKENIGNSDTKVSDVNKNKTWRDDYEIISFGEGKVGSYAVYVAELKATTNVPSYAKSKYYIRQDAPIILKAEDFSTNDRLMRTALFPKYTKVQGQYIQTQVIVTDEVNKGEKTQQIMSEISFAKIPDKVFTKAYLEQIN